MARARRESTPADMVRSLLVILIPVVIITVVFTRNVSAPPVTQVDWRPILSQARAEAGFPIFAPANLPDGWRVTKASWVRQGQPDSNGNATPSDTWQFGVLSPDDIYLAVDQRKNADPTFLATNTRDGQADGQSRVGSTTWNRTVSSDDRTRALSRTVDSAALIVVGDTSYAALESFTATLSSS